ncbi:MAG: F0F1 ATP synthase subunit delta [Gemmatimonadaceae bacterium]
MRETTIGRNYAEALLALARKANDLNGWGRLISSVADAVQREPRLQNFLAAPQIAAADKIAVVRKAFGGTLPSPMVRFLEKLIMNRRQLLIPAIATEYGNLVDEAEGRVHAQVTVAREMSDADRTMIAAQLSRRAGKTVVPHLHVNPAILGGVVVRIGDTVMDGSVRRRLSALRARIAR